MINREVNLFGIFALLLFWKFVNPLNAIFILGNRIAGYNHFHDNPIEQALGMCSLKLSYRSKVRTAFAASPAIVNPVQAHSGPFRLALRSMYDYQAGACKYFPQDDVR